jgi:hypothetical protein
VGEYQLRSLELASHALDDLQAHVARKQSGAISS